METLKKYIAMLPQWGLKGVTLHKFVKMWRISLDLENYSDLWRIRYIPKRGSSEKRKLVIPNSADLKLVQSAVALIFSNVFESSEHAYAYKEGTGPARAAWKAAEYLRELTGNQNNGTMLSIDIRHYFESFTYSMIKEFLESKGWDYKSAMIVATVITYKGRMVVGTVASPVVSNVISKDMIDELHDLAVEYKAEMISYSDNVFYLGSADHAEVWPEVLQKATEIINKYSFKINKRKTRVYKNIIKLLGTEIVNGSVRVDSSILSYARAMLHNVAQGKEPHDPITKKSISPASVLARFAWAGSVNKKYLEEYLVRYWFRNLRRKFGDEAYELIKPYIPVRVRERIEASRKGKDTDPDLMEFAEVLS